MTIWNLGSINIDKIYRLPRHPAPGETLAALSYATGLGGKGANQSIAETGPIFAALGMAEGVSPEQMQKNLQARTQGTPEAEEQREAIRKAIALARSDSTPGA